MRRRLQRGWHITEVKEMRKLLFAIATLALLADPVVAMPIDPAPAVSTVSDGQIITARYGHYRRVGRRTMRRVYRRGYYGGGYGYWGAYYGGGYAMGVATIDPLTAITVV